MEYIKHEQAQPSVVKENDGQEQKQKRIRRAIKRGWHAVKRPIQKWAIAVDKAVGNGENIANGEERRAVRIIVSMLVTEDTEILMHPASDRYYIKYEKGEVFVKFNSLLREVNIVNHEYDYHFKLGQRAALFLYRKFRDEIERRRAEMEEDYKKNVKSSLDVIYKRVQGHKEQKNKQENEG